MIFTLLRLYKLTIYNWTTLRKVKKRMNEQQHNHFTHNPLVMLEVEKGVGSQTDCTLLKFYCESYVKTKQNKTKQNE